jgi:glycosyltransferase involved in cell wall biosynthesis
MVAEKLTVVQILPELEEGGVEGETVDLATYLAKHGHRSIVISAGGRLVPQLEKAGCIHLCWPYIGEKSYRCLQYITRLKNYLVDEKVDILHLRSRLPAWVGYLSWRLIDPRLRPSLVTTFHGFYSINSYSKIMTRGQRVVAVSETIREHIVKNYNIERKRISLIHGGFDVKEFSPEAVTEQRIEKLREKWLTGLEDRYVILLPGRLTLWKGQEVLIDSLALIKERDFICLLVGDTEENPAYTRKLRDRIAQRGLESRVKLVGHCNDMPAALMLANVVVSASSTQPEAFGKVSIEAMAMGKAVIATAHGGSLETVLPGETGWLVPANDPAAMSEAVITAMADIDNCHRFGHNGREHVLGNFTARMMCEKTIALYHELYTEKNHLWNRERITVMQLLPELNSGGVERGTLEMGRFLVQQNHKSIVVSGGGRLVEQLEKDGSVHIRKTIGSKNPIALFHILPLRKLIKNGVDVLHLRSRMPAWIGYLAWLSILPKKRPVLVTTFHGFYSINAYSAIMTKGDGVIAVSASIEKHILDKYHRKEKVRLIFRGVDGQSFHPEKVAAERVERLRKNWNIDQHKPVLMLPGRLTRLKGQEVFLKSLLLVKERDFQAILVGDTEDNPGYTAELQNFIAQHNLSKKVQLVGYCTDMPAAFLLANIVISASSLEPEAFGRTTVEAMAMAKPVIVTAHGGSLETVIPGENGWLVRPDDPADLARAIDEALTADKRLMMEIGSNNRKRVTANFTANAMCEQTLAFYFELLAEKSSFPAQVL